MRNRLITAVTLGLSLLSAQVDVKEFESKVGTTAASFLKIGVGPRAMAMGEAFVAAANGPTAAFWNPAGLGRMEGTNFAASSTDWVMDLRLHSAVAATALKGGGGIAFSVNTLQMDDVEVTTLRAPDGDGTYAGASDVMLGLSYGRPLTDVFVVGVTCKWIYSKIANESASASAIDVGTLFSPGWRGLKIGMSLTNFGTKMRLDGRDLNAKHDVDPLLGLDEPAESRLRTRDWDLPTAFRLGIALNMLESDSFVWTATADGIHTTDNVERANLGSEISFGKIKLRAGGGLNYDQIRLGFGGGVTQNISGKMVTIDYAAVTLNPFGLVQSISLTISP